MEILWRSGQTHTGHFSHGWNKFFFFNVLRILHKDLFKTHKVHSLRYSRVFSTAFSASFSTESVESSAQFSQVIENTRQAGVAYFGRPIVSTSRVGSRYSSAALRTASGRTAASRFRVQTGSLTGTFQSIDCSSSEHH